MGVWGGRMLSDQQSPGGGREDEFWRGSALHRASSRPLEREDYGEDWRRGEGQRRRVNEQVVKVFRGRLGEREGGGAWMFHWASETEGEGGREGETPVR